MYYKRRQAKRCFLHIKICFLKEQFQILNISFSYVNTAHGSVHIIRSELLRPIVIVTCKIYC